MSYIPLIVLLSCISCTYLRIDKNGYARIIDISNLLAKHPGTY